MNVPIRPFAAITITCALALAFATMPPARAQTAPSSKAADLPNGFYRDKGAQTVYRVQGGQICAVLSEGHLKALGANHRSVQVLENPVDFLNGKTSRPGCPWPDGLYRRRGETTIIKVSDGTACVLSSTDQDVIEVSSGDTVTAGKEFTGRCTP